MINRYVEKKRKTVFFINFNTLFLVAILLLCQSITFAQFSISGEIIDAETKKSLAGATIVLENTLKGTVADAQGHFNLKPLKQGVYSLKVTYVGFQKSIQVIDLKGSTKVVVLLSKSSFTADEVIVSATRANAKSAMAYSDVSKEDLQKQNLGQDIPQLLNFTPSIVTTSDAGAGVGYTGIRIRGTDATRINVTINGIPLNDAESQGVYWVNMPDLASSVNSVQIQRGVGTSTNGAGAFGASVNVSTNEFRKDPYAEINTSVGSFKTLKNTILLGSGLLNNHFTVDARLSKVNSNGYIDRSSSDLKSFYLSGAYFGKKSFVRLNVFSGKEKTYQAWWGVSQSVIDTNRTYNYYTYPNQTDNYQQDHYQLLTSHQLSSDWTFNVNLHYTYGRGYYEEFKSGDALANYGLPNVVLKDTILKTTNLIRQKWLDNDFYGTTFSFDYQGKKGLSANIGGAWNQYDGRHFGKVIWAEYASTSKPEDHYYDGKALKTDFNIYGKLFYQVSEKLNSFLDLQYRKVDYAISGTESSLTDVSQAAHYNFFNPKVGLTYQINDKTSAYASYSVGNKEPNRTDFDDNLRKVPQAEKLQDIEVGYKAQAGKAAFSANVYYMNYTNQLVLTGKLNDVGSSIRVNVPESYRLGLELQGGLQLNSQLKWNVNATFSSNKIKNFIEQIPMYDADFNFTGYKDNNFQSTAIAFSPSVVAGSQLLFTPVKGLEFGLLTKYVGKQYLDNTSDEGRKLNAYFTNDLRGIYTIKIKGLREISFSVLANNIFSTLYESNGYTYSYYYVGEKTTENYYYPQAKANFMAGISLKF